MHSEEIFWRKVCCVCTLSISQLVTLEWGGACMCMHKNISLVLLNYMILSYDTCTYICCEGNESGLFSNLLIICWVKRAWYLGVKQLKIGDLLYACSYAIFDPCVFVFVWWSIPSHISLNRIHWFIDPYPYQGDLMVHPFEFDDTHTGVRTKVTGVNSELSIVTLHRIHAVLSVLCLRLLL